LIKHVLTGTTPLNQIFWKFYTYCLIFTHRLTGKQKQQGY
jgi:hypothetical protein